MEQPLLTIGAFARAVGLAPSTLRYYDECGLLSPAEVDESTGYRYYTPDLARRARAVVQMRETGMSVESMRTALDGTEEDRRQVLRRTLSEQETLVVRRREILEELLAGTRDDADSLPITVDGAALAAAIRQVRVACHTGPASPMSGVLLDFDGETLDVVATNRYWMAVRTLFAPAPGAGRGVLAMGDVDKTCELLDQLDSVTAEFSEDALRVAAQTVPIPDPGYPAHRMVVTGVPEPVTRVVLPRAELMSVICALKDVEVDLVISESGVRLAGEEVRGLVTAAGASVRISRTLFQQAVACLLGPELVLELTGDRHPVRLRSPYQPDFTVLLMPIGPDGADHRSPEQ